MPPTLHALQPVLPVANASSQLNKIIYSASPTDTEQIVFHARHSQPDVVAAAEAALPVQDDPPLSSAFFVVVVNLIAAEAVAVTRRPCKTPAVVPYRYLTVARAA